MECPARRYILEGQARALLPLFPRKKGGGRAGEGGQNTRESASEMSSRKGGGKGRSLPLFLKKSRAGNVLPRSSSMSATLPSFPMDEFCRRI